jgi:hypothetical protein
MERPLLPPHALALARTLLNDSPGTKRRHCWALQAGETRSGCLHANARHLYLFEAGSEVPFDLTVESAGLRCSVAAWHLDTQLNAALLWNLELSERPTERHFAPRFAVSAGLVCLQLTGLRGDSLRYQLRVLPQASSPSLPTSS